MGIDGSPTTSPTASPKSWRRAKSFTSPSKAFSSSNLAAANRSFASPSLTRRSSWPRRPSSALYSPVVVVEVLATEYNDGGEGKKKKPTKTKTSTTHNLQHQLPGLPNMPKLSRTNKLGLPAFKPTTAAAAAMNTSLLASRTSSPASFNTWSSSTSTSSTSSSNSSSKVTAN